MNNPHKNARTCLYSREQIVGVGAAISNSAEFSLCGRPSGMMLGRLAVPPRSSAVE